MTPNTVEMADRTKKRKRNADDASNSTKKVVAGGSHNVTVTLNDADKWAPIIASTPGVDMPHSLALKPYAKSRRNAPSRAGRSGPIATTELLLHSSAHPTLDYTAREEEAGGSEALLKHYVGVYNPENGQLEVMEARKMIVRGSVRAQQVPVEGEVSTNMRELRNTLGQTFGTKKARKAIASITENAIAPAKAARLLANDGKTPKLDSASKATLEAMKTEALSMSSQKDLAEAADSAKPRPKANTEAVDIKDVYTTQNLIGDDIFQLVPVRDWQQAAQAKKEIKNLSSRYVAARITKFAAPTVAHYQDTAKLRILRYMLYMLDFLGCAKLERNSKRLPKKNDLTKALGDAPESVQESIRRKFSTNGFISKFQSDLLITHLCALACLVDNYEVDMFPLKEDLKLENKEIAQYFHEIGAKIVPPTEQQRKAMGLDKAAAAQRKFAKLRIPLDFPRVSFARGRPR
ncbi:a49-like RNA polymerase I associated factor [Phlyctema vagabunda]|uniref:A49-like RNA polymerase I associated factor n=1 Tax=Phlyctema vagabunda TaxID=108571 RepID=A0ABR4PUQ9_9HELO